ncbi:MAG: hypothetical protein ACLUDU_01465 [Butyricimonas faecihominis]
MYLEPGDRAEVNILEDTLMITDRNTPENLLLARWESMMIPVRKRLDDMKYVLFDYRDFYPYFEAFLPQAEKFKDEITLRDATFAALVKQTVDYDLDYAAFRILNALKATKKFICVMAGRLIYQVVRLRQIIRNIIKQSWKKGSCRILRY